MTMPSRRSPLHDVLSAKAPTWADVQGMPVPVRLPREEPTSPLRVTDASFLRRMGVKGSQAESWLVAQGVTVPAAANSWTHAAEGATVARLARSEFFVEDRCGGELVNGLARALRPAPGVYPVLRQDAALVVAGERVHELFAQTCSVNFKAWKLDQRAVVMTSMAGVSVLVLWDTHHAVPCYRIWCDGTFGPYLLDTLLKVADALGGGLCGLECLYPEVKQANSISA